MRADANEGDQRMATDLHLAIAHHLLIFVLFGILVSELVLTRQSMTGDDIKRLASIDLWYGIEGPHDPPQVAFAPTGPRRSGNRSRVHAGKLSDTRRSLRFRPTLLWAHGQYGQVVRPGAWASCDRWDRACRRGYTVMAWSAAMPAAEDLIQDGVGLDPAELRRIGG